ncbi:LCP family protein [Nanchangia anserum]|uniref:LCP family protein n=1 Tax=Nanchangia anserum TaxID=2692125 RepID=A0A8I0G8X3_9ACTO|nr:LCP family protein [Nanchangia anserum]MBD3690090.1 LCP family protein [Nanchangia anserum]
MGRNEDKRRSYVHPQHLREARAPRLWLRNLLAALLAVVIFAGSAAAFMGLNLMSAVNVSSADDLLDRAPSDSYAGRALNILVIGSDSRRGAGNKIDNSEDTSDRSDTTMIVHVSKDRKRATIVSLPRDTLVDIPACKLPDGSSTRPQRGQFNWAFTFGGESGSRDAAIACTVKTVEDITQLHIDDYVLVDFNGFTQMIDALGGIDVYVDQAVRDRNTDLDLAVGCHHMGGHEALQYARVRHGVQGGDGSDLQRIGRQQHVMSIMMRQALSKNLLTSGPSLYKFARAGLSALTMSPTLSDLSTMTGLSYSLRGIDPANVLFLSAPVTPSTVDPNRVVFTDAAGALWEALRTDSALPGGLEVKDGYSTASVTPDPAATPAPTEDSSSAPASDAPATTQTPAASPSPSTDDAAAKLEAARRECEAKG